MWKKSVRDSSLYHKEWTKRRLLLKINFKPIQLIIKMALTIRCFTNTYMLSWRIQNFNIILKSVPYDTFV